jgi:hypothetical protein
MVLLYFAFRKRLTIPQTRESRRLQLRMKMRGKYALIRVESWLLHRQSEAGPSCGRGSKCMVRVSQCGVNPLYDKIHGDTELCNPLYWRFLRIRRTVVYLTERYHSQLFKNRRGYIYIVPYVNEKYQFRLQTIVNLT